MPEKKLGRPPKRETPRNVSLNIRLTLKESNDIQECADKLKTSRTDTIMRGITLLKEKLTK